MALRNYANAPATTLAASCTTLDTVIQVASTAGLPIAYPYILILDRGTNTEEVVLVTNATGVNLSVTRGYDSTTAFAHNLGAPVVHGISAIDAREANTHVNASTGVHGVTGALVGTTDAQTLTNKTLGATNSLTGFTANKLMQSDATGKIVSGTKNIPVGEVVGTTDTQTLTNKTLTGAKTSVGGDVVGTTDAQTLTNKTFNSTSPTAFLPPGMMAPYVGSSAPTGWLLCNGAAVSRTTFAGLFAVIGTAFGAGDGSTTFNLPDLRDRAPFGASGSKALGTSGGQDSRVIAESHLPPHTHGINVEWAQNTAGGGTNFRVVDIQNITGGAGTDSATATTGTGSFANNPFNFQNPYQAVNYIVKT